MSNVKEVKARGADVIGIATESHKAALAALVDSALSIPDIHPMFLPSLEVIPMQLFAYYVALMRGCDIDKPRNLARASLWSDARLSEQVQGPPPSADADGGFFTREQRCFCWAGVKKDCLRTLYPARKGRKHEENTGNI